MHQKKSITILLCTHNGERYVYEQIRSILNQKLKPKQIIVSDDNSNDSTLKILKEIKNKDVDIILLSGPCKGPTDNFLSTILSSQVKGDFFSFCDQDDIFLPEHLERAISYLSKVPDNIPALFCSRTALIDEHGKKIGLSPENKKPPSFRNAIIQNLASGNTMIFNKSARDLLGILASHTIPVWHDWALYQVVTACGGKVIYSKKPTVLYRQHSNNFIGAKFDWSTRIKRITLVMQGRYHDWNTKNIEALESIKPYMADDSKKTLEEFKKLREIKSRWLRIIALYKSGIHRQSAFDQLLLYIAIWLGRV